MVEENWIGKLVCSESKNKFARWKCLMFFRGALISSDLDFGDFSKRGRETKGFQFRDHFPAKSHQTKVSKHAKKQIIKKPDRNINLNLPRKGKNLNVV